MREEINRRESALNDAELANVSGGDGSLTPPEMYELYQLAERLCTICPIDMTRCNDGGIQELRNYMLLHGAIESFSQCPYYRR